MSSPDTLLITCKDAESYSSALADILCWCAGFKAAGGDTGPVNLETLRDLNIRLKSIEWKEE